MLRKTLVLLAPVLLCASFAPAGDVVLYDPASPVIKASAIDQPILNAYLAYGADPNLAVTSGGEAVVFNAFVDTGASSSMISYLQATGLYEVPSLGFDSNTYVGDYTETGIGGQEAGKVSRPFNVFVLSGNSNSAYGAALGDFAHYGAHNLWVRQAEGVGEAVSLMDFPLVDPVNIVGMPVIRQRVMEMDFTPLKNVDFSSAMGGLDIFSLLDSNASLDDLDVSSLSGSSGMNTRLLEAGSPALHATNVTLQLRLKNFVGAPPPGQVLPTSSANPVVPHISVARDANGTTRRATENEWLFDTGAGSSFISFRRAQELGLIPLTDGNLAQFMATYSGPALPIGGVGQSVNVPRMRVDEIRVPAKEGFDLVWKNVDVLVLDILSDANGGGDSTLDGVFGMNLLAPSANIDVTVDPAMLNLSDATDVYDMLATMGSLSTLLDSLMDFSPGYFDYAAFDATNPDNVELRLWTDAAPEPGTLAMLAAGACCLLRRNRRLSDRNARRNVSACG
jgi:hypothetical protein